MADDDDDDDDDDDAATPPCCLVVRGLLRDLPTPAFASILQGNSPSPSYPQLEFHPPDLHHRGDKTAVRSCHLRDSESCFHDALWHVVRRLVVLGSRGNFNQNLGSEKPTAKCFRGYKLEGGLAPVGRDPPVDLRSITYMATETIMELKVRL